MNEIELVVTGRNMSGAALDGARRDLTRVGTSAEDASRRADRSFGRLDDAARRAGRTAEQAGDRSAAAMVRAGRATNRAGDDLRRFERRAGGAQDAAGGLGDQAGQAGGALSRLGPVGAAAAATVAAALVGATLAAKQLSDAVGETIRRGKTAAQQGASIGLDPQQARQLGERAGRLYAQGFGESVDESTEAVAAVTSSLEGMRSATEREVDAAAAKALTLANTFRIDVSEAVQSVGTLLSSGLAKDANHAFDLITRASQKVPAALRGDVLDASDEYAQFFRSLGFSGEQAFALLVQASAKGTYGIDRAGDAIKEFTLRATEMSKSTTDAYKSIGLDAETMSNDLLAGGDRAQKAFQKVVAGILSIKDPTAQAQAAVDLFGTPIEDLNKSDIPEFLRNMAAAGAGLDGVAGATERAGETLKSYPVQVLDRIKRRWEDLQATIGERLAPSVEKALGWLEKAAESEKFQQFVGKIERAVNAVAEKALPKLKEQWEDVVQAFEDNQEEIEVVGHIIATIFSKTVVDAIGRFLQVLEIAIKVTGALERAWESAIRIILGHLGTVVSGAAKAFGWMPGLGPKLRQAEKDFANFAKEVNAKLASIKDKTVNVTVKYREQGRAVGITSDYSSGIGGRASGGIAGGLTWVGERGAELVELPHGSRVIPNGTSMAMAGSSGGGGASSVQVSIRTDGTALGSWLMEGIRHGVRIEGGGDVQLALGS